MWQRIIQKDKISKGLGLVLVISYIEFILFILLSFITLGTNFTLGLAELVFSVIFVIVTFLVQLNINIARMAYVALAVVEFFLFMTFINIWVAIVPIIPGYVLVFDSATLKLFEKNKPVVNQNVS